MSVTPDLDMVTPHSEKDKRRKDTLSIPDHTERRDNSLVSSNRVFFHLAYILGIFPARLGQGDILHISLFWDSLPYLFWGILHGVTIYFFYWGASLDGYFQEMDKPSHVGCNSTVTRGPDYIYQILDFFYPTHNFLLSISTLFLARAISPSINKVSALLNKPDLRTLVSQLFNKPG